MYNQITELLQTIAVNKGVNDWALLNLEFSASGRFSVINRETGEIYHTTEAFEMNSPDFDDNDHQVLYAMQQLAR